MMRWLPLLFPLAAIVYSAADFSYYYDKLPPRVATHFDFQGNANGWTSKEQFANLAIITFAVVAVVLAAIPLIIRLAPRDLINLPNKDYWLTPEREAETRAAITRWSFWFAAATLWFLAVLFHQAMLANLRQPPELQGIWWLAGAYILATLVLSLQIITRFSRLPIE